MHSGPIPEDDLELQALETLSEADRELVRRPLLWGMSMPDDVRASYDRWRAAYLTMIQEQAQREAEVCCPAIMATPASKRVQLPVVECVERVLVISTAHVPADTAALLDQWAQPNYPHGVPMMRWDYGWCLWVGDAPDDPEVLEAAPALRAIFDATRAADCHWVRLDSDAPMIDGLPTWEW